MHKDLYSATYSGVAVYEFIHPKSSVMRRKKDGWVNATHILKVANFPKAKRTRILEKDVQTGVHEKVQGGYGKYQGTWVPLDRAIEIAQQFDVLDDLTPVFNYVSDGTMTPPPAPKHHHATTASGTRKPRATQSKKTTSASDNTVASKEKTKLTPRERAKAKKDKEKEKDKQTKIDKMKPPSSASITTTTTTAAASTQRKNKRQKQDPALKSNSKPHIPSPLNIPTYPSSQPLSASASGSAPSSASRNSLQLPSFNNFSSMGTSNSLGMTMNAQTLPNLGSFDSKRVLKAPKRKLSSISNQYSPYSNNLNGMNGAEDDLDVDDDDDDEDEDEDEDDDLNGNFHHHPHSHTHGLPHAHDDFRRLHEPSTVEFMSDQDIDKALAESETYGTEKKTQTQQVHHAHNSFFLAKPLSLSSYLQQTPSIHMISAKDSIAAAPTSAEAVSHPPLDKSFVKALYNYFIEMDSNPHTEMPHFITHDAPDFNVNQPIDNQGNTALHWACAMGDSKMCEILLKRGCNVRSLNNKGEEPLIRSVIYANCYTRRTFSKLLNLLELTLLDIDLNSRTLLHHVAMATSDVNNLPAARYYTEILMRKIAETAENNDDFKQFVNKQDVAGNTALHIFSFNGAKKCVNILLGYNARVDIRNKNNDQVSDYLGENFKSGLNIPGFITSSHNGGGIGGGASITGESFNLRPFRPQLQPVDEDSIMNSHNPHIGMDPFQAANPSMLLNLTQSGFLNTHQHQLKHHDSVTSKKLSQVGLDVLERLNELSNSFDAEIKQKNDDLRELTSILQQMDDDIKKINTESKTLVESILTEDLGEEEKVKDEPSQAEPVVDTENINGGKDNAKIDVTITKVQTQIGALLGEYNGKEDLLKRLIDRSQAMDLAKIVQKYEHESLSKIEDAESPSLESSISKETLLQLVELSKLQVIRKKSVGFLVNINAVSECNKDLLNSYRRLVARLSNMPLSEVDASLNSIEECLRRDIDIGTLDNSR